jgi:hypothetical protein
VFKVKNTQDIEDTKHFIGLRRHISLATAPAFFRGRLVCQVMPEPVHQGGYVEYQEHI